MDTSSIDIEAVRRATREMLGDPTDVDFSYITAESIAEFDGVEETVPGDTGVEAGPFYGNHPKYIPDALTKPGYVGKLLIYNGSANRPNDPCGSKYRRLIWCRYSPVGTQYRNCGSFWGFEWLSV